MAVARCWRGGLGSCIGGLSVLGRTDCRRLGSGWSSFPTVVIVFDNGRDRHSLRRRGRPERIEQQAGEGQAEDAAGLADVTSLVLFLLPRARLMWHLVILYLTRQSLQALSDAQCRVPDSCTGHGVLTEAEIVPRHPNIVLVGISRTRGWRFVHISHLWRIPSRSARRQVGCHRPWAGEAAWRCGG